MNVAKFSLFLLFLLATDCVLSENDKAATELFDEFWTWRLERSPEFSSLTGSKVNNDRLESFTEERFAEDVDTCKGFIDRATDILDSAEDEDTALNLEYLIAELQTFVVGYPFKGTIIQYSGQVLVISLLYRIYVSYRLPGRSSCRFPEISS